MFCNFRFIVMKFIYNINNLYTQLKIKCLGRPIKNKEIINTMCISVCKSLGTIITRRQNEVLDASLLF